MKPTHCPNAADPSALLGPVKDGAETPEYPSHCILQGLVSLSGQSEKVGSRVPHTTTCSQAGKRT